MIIFILIALDIVSIFACHYLAKSRGARPVFWGVLGAVFGSLAIPFAFLARPEIDSE